MGTLTLLAWVTVLWLLVLATGWIAFVAWLRVTALRQRGRVRVGTLGAGLREGEPLTDAEDAFREEVARLRSRIERQTGERVR